MRELIFISIVATLFLACEDFTTTCTTSANPSILVYINGESVPPDSISYTIEKLNSTKKDSLHFENFETTFIEESGEFYLSIYSNSELVKKDTLLVESDECHVKTVKYYYEG